MKISELGTEQATDVMCALIPHIDRILKNKELVAELKRKTRLPENADFADKFSVGLDKLEVIIPIVLKKERQSVFSIIALLNSKTAEEVAKQNFLTTAKQVRDLFKDKELIDFFKSCV